MSIRRRATLLLILPFLTLLACVAPGFYPPQPTRPASTIQPSFTATPSLTVTAVATATYLPAVASGTPTAPMPKTSTPAGTPSITPTANAPAGLELPLSSLGTAPPGILPLVGVFQTGGGAGFGGGSDCENKPGEIRWCSSLNGEALPRTESYEAAACGFDGGDLDGRVLLPDGRSEPIQVAGVPPSCRELTYLPGPTAPLGKYQVTLRQGSATLTDTFELSPPTAPSGALFQNCAWLAGLPKASAVRLLAFGLAIPGPESPAPDPGLAVWRFLNETRLSADPAGSLLACPDSASQGLYLEFVYLASFDNQAPLLLGDADLLQQFQGICANGPVTRLAVNKKARVISDSLPLFSDPGLNVQPLELLGLGASVTLLNGPACPPQGPWVWQVKTSGGQTGWLPEADQTNYFLEPLP